MDGWERLVINPNERAISTDIIRLQAFKGADAAEIWRALLDTSSNTDNLDASSFGTSPGGGSTSQTSPVSAAVLNGLAVIPAVGSLSLQVQPGICFLYDPDATPNSDESQYKFVRDPGVQTPGVLLMTANSSGSTRIDVIEVARANIAGGAPDAVIETDNRDQYNTTTGLFSATTVNKVTAGRLQYRVRAGTPGGGFPGTAAGWMPLVVASVPTGTTTNDTITFWDVRPLVEDRVLAPFNLTTQRALSRGFALADDATNNPKTILTGEVSCGAPDLFSTTGNALYRLGGRIRRGSPGLDGPNAGLPDGVDLNDAANQSGAMIASSPTYVYLAEPFSLPRWARYTDAASGARKPRSCRGMLIVSQVGPYHYSVAPSGSITLPASMGFNGAGTSKAACIFVTSTNGAARVMGGVMDEARNCFWNTQTYSTPAGTLTGGGTANQTVTFNLSDGSTHPPNAKALWVVFSFTYSTAGNLSQQLQMFAKMQVSGGGPTPFSVQQSTQLPFTDATFLVSNPIITWLFRVPIIPAYPSISSPANRQLAVNIQSAAGFTLASQTMQVVGAELV